jgi:hypothetical protein
MPPQSAPGPVFGYSYLWAGEDSARDPSTVVELAVGPEVVNKVVVRDTRRCRYYVFDTWDELWKYSDSLRPGERCLEEVIFGTKPRRLAFDIDADESKLDAVRLLRSPSRVGAPVQCSDEDVTEFLAEIAGSEPAAPEPAAPEPAAPEPAAPEPAAPEPAAQGPTYAETGAEKARALIDALIEAILDELYATYYGDSIGATRRDIAVFDSSGPTAHGWKYSYHVVVLPYAVPDGHEAKAFAAAVAGHLPPAARGLVDLGVYKSVQNFRLAGSAKAGSVRVKQLGAETAAAHGTATEVADRGIIAARDVRVLTRALSEAPTGEPPAAEVSDLGGRAVTAVLAAATAGAGEAYMAPHSLSRVRGQMLLFTRQHSSHCALCGRTHDSDNTLMLFVEPTDDGLGADGRAVMDAGAAVPHRVIERCRHAPPGKVRYLATVGLRPAESGPHQRPAQRGERSRPGVGARAAAVAAGEVDPHAATATRLHAVERRHVYAEPAMRAFEDDAPTLVVKAQMGLGKTKELRQLLDRRYPPSAVRPPRIVMLTFRRAFANSVWSGSFSDFELYTQLKDDTLSLAAHPRLIIQAESTWRLSLGPAPEPVDCLVIDESASVLMQYNSPLHRHFEQSFAVFLWLLRTARQVVMLDANAGDAEMAVLERNRPHAPPLLHWNQYELARDRRYWFTHDQGVWLDHLYARLEAGQRLVLPFNSKAEAKAVVKDIEDRFPALKVGLYTGDTAAAEKELHFSDVARYWSELDVLAFTPTVSAGISFELPRFDALFGYFTDMSCQVEICSQMLSRVRNIATRDFALCVVASGNALPDTVEAIDAAVRARRAHFTGAAATDSRAYSFEYDWNGHPMLHESPFYTLWLELTRGANLSKNAFDTRFVDLLAATGAAVAPLEPLDGADRRCVAIKALHKTNKVEIERRHAEDVAAAPPIGADEAADIEARLRRAHDAPDGAPTQEERMSLELAKVCAAYRWHGRPVSTEFILQYGAPGARRVYRNLCAITAGPSIDASLAAIVGRAADADAAVADAVDQNGGWRAAAAAADRPAAYIGHARSALALDARVLNPRPGAQAHMVAIELLRAADFCCVVDRGLIRAEAVCLSLRVNLARLLQLLPVVASMFECRVPWASTLSASADEAFLKHALGVVNVVLRQTYGVEIRRTKKSVGAEDFALVPTSVGRMFPISAEPDPDDRVGGPRPHVPCRLKKCTRDYALENFIASLVYNANRAHTD